MQNFKKFIKINETIELLRRTNVDEKIISKLTLIMYKVNNLDEFVRELEVNLANKLHGMEETLLDLEEKLHDPDRTKRPRNLLGYFTKPGKIAS